VDDGKAGAAALVDETSLVSFASIGSFNPTFTHRSTPTPSLPCLFSMSATNDATRKRKAEPRERQDGGNKRAKVSCFLRATVKSPSVAAVLARNPIFVPHL
jgi:hypothetical protein